MHLIKVFLTLPHGYRGLLFRALAMVVVVRVGLWILPYRVVRDALDRTTASRSTVRTDEEVRYYRKRAVWAVGAVSKRLLGSKPCLVQALVGRWLLARRGIETEIRIGVSKEGHVLLAHAWLEQGGRILLGGADSPSKYEALRPTRLEEA